MNSSRLHLLISGQVQGVAYRFSARRIAVDLGLTGWVRNMADGQVEIIAEGDSVILEQLSSWAKQGPRYANVSNVTVSRLPATGEFNAFVIR